MSAERKAAMAAVPAASPPVPSWPDSMLLDDPGWPLQVLELALRGVLAEAHDNRLDNEDVTRMVEPIFALAYDARRAATAREAQG